MEQNIKLTITADNKQALNAGKEVNKELDKISAPRMMTAAKSALNKATGGVAGPAGDSSMSRGVMGATKAEGRDFAKQAQGLGGLVHVYATFAANIFAVSAAFGALSRAADTTNMIKGLDQLGASSGRALGSLSKQLVSVADGAISLREAMTATAQASAGGMTNAAILRMGTVAKQASQALGVAMPDAISRLTRGITKLEPELLDEIGIMVRVDKSSQDYARTIGKTASALTDFEKRQAFANAVLEQGEKKFGSIQIDANPYSKILASMQNLAQQGLELTNTVLGPLLKLLSTSPTALAVAMAGIASVLLKQAIPAIGMFRQNARAMEEETHARVVRQVAEQRDAAIKYDVIAAEKAEKEFMREKGTQDRINKMRLAPFNEKVLGKEVRSLLRKSPYDLTPEETTKIVNKHKELADKIASNTANKSDSDQYKKLEDRANKLRTLEIDREKVATAASDKNEAADQRWLSTAKQKEMVLDRLTKAAAKRTILSNAADNVATMGPSIAFQQLREETKKLDAGAISKFATNVKGSFIIATGAVTNFMAAFGPWIALAGLLVAAVGGIISYMSKTKKESVETTEAMDNFSSSIAAAGKTIDALKLKSTLEQVSIESIQARATALNELAVSAEAAVRKSNKELDKLGTSNLDTFTNWVSKAWGGDVQSKLNKNISDSVIEAFKLLENGPSSDKAKEAISKVLGTSISDSSSLEKALSSMSDKGRVAVTALIPELQKLALSAGNTASKGVELKASWEQSSKAFNSFTNSLKATDPLSILGEEMISSANKMKIAIDDPTQALNAMASASSNIDVLKLFPKEAALNLIKYSDELTELQKKQAGAQVLLQSYTEKLAELEKQKADLIKGNNEDNKGRMIPIKADTSDIDAQIKDLFDNKRYSINVIADINNKLPEIRTVFEKALMSQFVAGAGIVTKGLDASWAKAGATIGSTIAGMLGDTKSGIEMRAKYESQALAAQVEGIKAQLDLTKATEKVAVQLALDAIERKKPGATSDQLKSLEKEESGLTYRKEVLASTNTKGATKKVVQDIEAGKDGAKEAYSYILKAETQAAALAGVQAQMAAVGMKAAIEKYMLERKTKAELTAIEIERSKIALDQLTTLESAVGLSGNALFALKQELTAQQQIAESKKRVYDLDTEIIKLETLKGMTKGKEAESIQKDINEKKATKDKVLALQKESEIANKLRADNESAARLASIKASETEKSNTMLDIQLSNLVEERNVQQEILDLKKSEGVLSEQDYISNKFVLDTKNAEFDTLGKIISIKRASGAEEENIVNKIAAIRRSMAATDFNSPSFFAGAADIEKMQVELTKIGITSENQVAILEKQLGIRLSILEVVKEQALFEAEQKEKMDDMVGLSDSLAKAFGDVGNALGASLVSMQKLANAETAYLRKKEKLQPNANDDVKDARIKAKELIKLEDKFTTEKLSNLGEIAGNTKKMFAEHTGAYKALDAAEKISHALAVANQVQMMAQQLAALPKLISGGVARLFEEGGWAGFAGAAAFLAMMSSLGAPVSASSIEPPKGSTAADQQALGAGQTYVDGKIVDNGGGVYGDSSAKSESLTRSLELLGETSVEGMEYSNKMVELLTSINDNISQAALSLYSVKGVRTGSGLGTVEETKSNPGFLGLFASSSSTSIINSGVQLSGTFLDLAKKGNTLAKGFETVQKSSSNSGFLGIGASSSTSINTNNFGLPPEVSENITNVFSSAASLFEVQGAKLGQDQKSVLDILAAVDVTGRMASLKGLKGEELDKELNAFLSSVVDTAAKALFPQLDKFKKFGEGFAQTVIRVLDTSEKITQAFKSIGKPMELLPETIGIGAQAASEALETAQAKYDELLATTEATYSETSGFWDNQVTTIKANEVGINELKQAETALAAARAAHVTAVSASTTRNLELTEAMANAAGGLSEFLDMTKAFNETYLTDAERLAPKQAALSEELTRLGVSTTITKDEMKNLILNYKVTTTAQAEHYVALLKVADGYAKVNQEIIAVADAAGLGVSGIADLIKSVNNADAEGTGASVAEMVLYGIQNAMYENAVTAVSQAIVDTVITPIIQSMMSGTLAADLMNGAFDSLYDKALNIANGLATAFADPKFQEMIASISNTISTAVITVGRVMPMMPKNPSERANASSGGDKKVEDPEGDEFKKLTKELEDLKDQGLTPAALLIKQSNALLSERNKEKFKEIQLEKEIQKTKKDQKDFDAKYIDSMIAIQQGTSKTNAEYTKLATTFLGLEGAEKLGLGISDVSNAFKELDSGTIYDFIMSMDKITVLSPEVKTGLLGIAQSLLSMKNATEQAKNSLESKIYTAQGNTEAALAITRAAELASLEESLHPRQKYLYALEDEANLKAKLKTAYDKEIGSMKDLIGKLKETSKTIKEYQNSLKLGELSTLTPEQKYAEAKSQAMELADIIASKDPSITMEDKIAAANKLPAAAEAVLTASKTLFASGVQYQDDYNIVQKYLTDLTTNIDSLVTPAEEQLLVLETSNAALTNIETSSAGILEQLKLMPSKIEEARLASEISGSTASGYSAAGAYFKQDPAAYTAFKTQSFGLSADQYAAASYAITGKGTKPDVKIDTATIATAFNMKREDIIAHLESRGYVKDIGYFARGGVASGMNWVGEEGPELVDFKTPARVYSNTASNQLLSNKELIEEMRKMREEIKQLRSEQKEQTGHLITSNYDANSRGAVIVADATQDAANAQLWAKRSGVKLN